MIDAPLYPWRGRPRPLQIAVVRNWCRFSICEGMRKRGVFFVVVDDIVTELSLRPWMGFSWLTSIQPSVGALHLMDVSFPNSGTFAPAKPKPHIFCLCHSAFACLSVILQACFTASEKVYRVIRGSRMKSNLLPGAVHWTRDAERNLKKNDTSL